MEVHEEAEPDLRLAFLTPARFADQQLPSWSIALRPAQGTAEKLAEQLRAASPAVWTTVDGGRVRLDLRTVLPRQDEPLVAALEALGLKPTAAPAASAGGASTSVETAQPTTGASEAASTGASPGSASTPESPSSG